MTAHNLILQPGDTLTVTVPATPVPPPVVVPPPVEPPPPSAGSWAVPFATRPASPPIRLNGVNGRVIENLSFRDVPAGQTAVILENCRDITIRWVDFARIGGCIFALNCADIKVEGVRFDQILGPYTRTGSPHGNFVQLDKTVGGYIRNCKGRGGNTEDMVSMFRSGGTAAVPFLIEDIAFDGAGWTSPSGSGIMLGDGGGSFVTVRRARFLNPGAVGIGIVGGSGHQIIDCIVKGEPRLYSNVGLSAWNRTAEPSTGLRWQGNKVDWKNESGGNNDRWIHGLTTVEVLNNDFTSTIDPASLRVVL